MSDLPDLRALKWCMLPDVLPPEVYSGALMARHELYRMLAGETSEKWWRERVARQRIECAERLMNAHVEGLVMEDFP